MVGTRKKKGGPGLTLRRRLKQAEVTEDSQWSPLSIRYDGNEADAHQMELAQLGASLQGFARVIAVCAHFAETGKYNKQYDTLSVKVYAAPVQEHHCYEVLTVIQSILGSKELWSGAGGAILVALIQYVFSGRKEEEMKYLNEALQKALGLQGETNSKLLATIEKMADALRPAARQAVQPIGTACTSIRLGDGVSGPVVLDEQTKNRLAVGGGVTIEPTRTFVGTISEMDMESSSCKVAIEGDPGPRVQAVITDPVGKAPDNPYVTSMSRIQPIKFLAKAEIDSDGSLIRLHISDVAQ